MLVLMVMVRCHAIAMVVVCHHAVAVVMVAARCAAWVAAMGTAMARAIAGRGKVMGAWQSGTCGGRVHGDVAHAVMRVWRGAHAVGKGQGGHKGHRGRGKRHMRWCMRSCEGGHT